MSAQTFRGAEFATGTARCKVKGCDFRTSYGGIFGQAEAAAHLQEMVEEREDDAHIRAVEALH